MTTDYFASVYSLLESVATEAPKKEKINRSCFFKFPPDWGALQPMVVQISVPTSQLSAPVKLNNLSFWRKGHYLPTLAPTGHTGNTCCCSAAVSSGFGLRGGNSVSLHQLPAGCHQMFSSTRVQGSCFRQFCQFYLFCWRDRLHCSFLFHHLPCTH